MAKPPHLVVYGGIVPDSRANRIIRSVEVHDLRMPRGMRPLCYVECVAKSQLNGMPEGQPDG
jgi:hypothetical protein